MKKSNTPRSQALAPQVLRKGEEKEERRKINTQTHSEGPCRGELDRIQTHKCGEGGNGERGNVGMVIVWRGTDARGRGETGRGREGKGGGGEQRGEDRGAKRAVFWRRSSVCD